jgi:hypothetical protein
VQSPLQSKILGFPAFLAPAGAENSAPVLIPPHELSSSGGDATAIPGGRRVNCIGGRRRSTEPCKLSREADMNRWEFLFAVSSVASLFVPVFVAVFSAGLTGDKIRAMRDRRIAAYRRSPASKLLKLDY